MKAPIDLKIDDSIAVLQVNRPQARNALNWAAQELFAQAVERVALEETARALIITGRGDTFVSGGDLKELAEEPHDAAGARLNRTMGAALAQLTTLPLPVIGAVNGHAAGGGCEILTACDLRLAVPGARLKFVQVRLALTTGWGGAARLVRQVGQSRAMEILLRGRTLSAEEALQIGFIHRVIDPGQGVLEEARGWARQLGDLPQGALAAMKRLVQVAPYQSAREAEEAERRHFTRLWGQPDHLEALSAFLEKRTPEFGE